MFFFTPSLIGLPSFASRPHLFSVVAHHHHHRLRTPSPPTPLTEGALERWRDGERPLRDYIETAASEAATAGYYFGAGVGSGGSFFSDAGGLGGAAGGAGGGLPRLLSEALRRVGALVTSPDPAERLGGVLAVDELIDVRALGEPGARMAALAGCLQHVLATAGGSPGDRPALEAAAEALGHLARGGGALAAEAV